MRVGVDPDQLDTEYPPEHECEVNNKECEFSPVKYICHECGKRACKECATGVVHQPRLIKYMRSGDSKEAHCPECAETHTVRLPFVLGGGLALIIGLAIAVLIGAPAALLIGGIIAVIGGYTAYWEFNLKKKTSMTTD
jgi:hypothetical protein